VQPAYIIGDEKGTVMIGSRARSMGSDPDRLELDFCDCLRLVPSVPSLTDQMAATGRYRPLLGWGGFRHCAMGHQKPGARKALIILFWCSTSGVARGQPRRIPGMRSPFWR
jgi:hypothetical protein